MSKDITAQEALEWIMDLTTNKNKLKYTPQFLIWKKEKTISQALNKATKLEVGINELIEKYESGTVETIFINETTRMKFIKDLQSLLEDKV